MARPLLHDYFRSSASYRVRIALRLKSVEHDSTDVDLRAGDQRADAYKARNPQGFVPMLEVDGLKLTQSLAIIAYLDATRPEPPLLPADPADQAHVRAMALLVACDIHPLNNLRVLNYLKTELGQDEPARNGWYRHWIAEGFAALEKLAAPRAGRFLFGDTPTIADVCLVPQMYNARRFDVPLDDYPLLMRVDAEANRLDAFAAAHPDRVAG
ncbi:maleylacetoacetate isomerase [Sphingosinicella sp. YJ22]|uniref:maleylacetoacetate isomerase n=1 Tax=Sphingosinicella sp. YJ22 TaxID=1104780 RepID=UPI00140BC943|nr:maleylacetoacetate isomerase [Sphingosinicella sp. YJ22]